MTDALTILIAVVAVLTGLLWLSGIVVWAASEPRVDMLKRGHD
jgi:hypothetical protein